MEIKSLFKNLRTINKKEGIMKKTVNKHKRKSSIFGNQLMSWMQETRKGKQKRITDQNIKLDRKIRLSKSRIQLN